MAEPLHEPTIEACIEALPAMQHAKDRMVVDRAREELVKLLALAEAEQPGLKADGTYDALMLLKQKAEEQNAVVDRIEVVLTGNGREIGFTAHLSPKPLEQATLCVSYAVGGGQ